MDGCYCLSSLGLGVQTKTEMLYYMPKSHSKWLSHLGTDLLFIPPLNLSNFFSFSALSAIEHGEVDLVYYWLP